MDAATISRIMDLVPERVVRVPTGSAAFVAERPDAPQPAARFRHLAGFLNWLTPLTPIGKDDQRILGLLSSGGRPLDAAGEEASDLPDESAELAEDGDELEAPDEAFYDGDERIAAPAEAVQTSLSPKPAE